MSTTISALPAANTIDGSADYFPIVTDSLGATQKINRNTFLGVTGSPADISTVQTLTNKVIGITNSVTQSDATFTIQNSVDNTKQVRFSVSGVTTGTTRVLTVPNATATLATLAGTETLTNKTITSPVISGGSIDNSTITVDSIAGHTSGTVVTVAGLQISAGVLNTANAVTATSVADGAIQPKALVAGTGSGWAWSSWSPTWTNLTVGNGTVDCKYTQVGKTVIARVSLIFGNTTAITGSVSMTVPVTAITYPGNASVVFPIGVINYLDSGTAQFVGTIQFSSTTTVLLQVMGAASTYVGPAVLSSSVPMTWTTNDGIFATIIYEAA